MIFSLLASTNWKVFLLTFTIGLIVAVLRGLLLFHVADYTADIVDIVGSELARDFTFFRKKIEFALRDICDSTRRADSNQPKKSSFCAL